MPSVDVLRTHLELLAPHELRPVAGDDPRLRVERLDPCPPSIYLALYRDVGADYHWRDRLAWEEGELAAYLERPTVSVWLASYDGETAGYFELARHEDESVEIVYFGLRRGFIGRGLGKRLLTRAVREAWALGARRVWLHTCSLDSPAALPNYLARGFRPFREEHYAVELAMEN